MPGQFPKPGNETAGSVVLQTDFDETESVSMNVLLALETLPDFDSESSEETLYEHVDPDALDNLFRSHPAGDRSEGWVRFPVGDYEVNVSSQGEIVIWSRPP